MKRNDPTPWGAADIVTRVADGIWFCSTPSHGGYKLSAERLAQLRQKFPGLKKTFAGFPWFEEDCDWAYVALAFPEHFPPDAIPHAQRVYDGWLHPRAADKPLFAGANCAANVESLA